ncbi:hypothetical protein [Aquimarina spongiae]|nr:hypothetical protein [Aquimarina spongiae]
MSTIMYYQLNIDYIVETYCVNKERPKLNCNGKCYLMSQMKAKIQPSEEQPDTIISAEAFIPLFFQDYTVRIKKPDFLGFEYLHNWKTEDLVIKTILNDIDHPPEFFLS